MRIRYDPSWITTARRRVDDAFNHAYQDTVSDRDIQELNELFREFQICLHFIERCDSPLHKKKVLPELVDRFALRTGVRLRLS